MSREEADEPRQLSAFGNYLGSYILVLANRGDSHQAPLDIKKGSPLARNLFRAGQELEKILQTTWASHYKGGTLNAEIHLREITAPSRRRKSSNGD